MRTYFDTVLGRLVSKPGYTTLLKDLTFKRGDSARFEVLPCAGTDASDIGAPTEMVFVVKGDFAEGTEPLLWANDFTEGTGGIWSSPIVASEELTTQLGSGASLTFKGELTITSAVLGTITSQTLVITIENDLWKGTEGTPLGEMDPEVWLEARRPAPLHLYAELPQSAIVGDPGLLTFVDEGDETAVDGDTIEFTATIDGEDTVEVWTFRDEADADALEIQFELTWLATLEGFAAKLRERSAIYEGFYKNDGAHPTITLVPKLHAELFDLEVVNYAGILIGSDSASPGDFGNTPTAATAVGQGLIVHHSDGTRSEWGCLRVTPVLWRPRGDGITWNADAEKWQRLTLTGGALDLTDLPDQ